jgi:hypothetical protein
MNQENKLLDFDFGLNGKYVYSVVFFFYFFGVGVFYRDGGLITCVVDEGSLEEAAMGREHGPVRRELRHPGAHLEGDVGGAGGVCRCGQVEGRRWQGRDGTGPQREPGPVERVHLTRADAPSVENKK